MGEMDKLAGEACTGYLGDGQVGMWQQEAQEFSASITAGPNDGETRPEGKP